jgi:hypothetical protein
MSRRHNRRTILRAVGTATAVGIAGCLGGDDGAPTTDGSTVADESTATNDGADSPFPAGSCLAAMTADVTEPLYGFEFADGPDPEVGPSGASTSGSVAAADGTATFTDDGGAVVVNDVDPLNDLTVSLFAKPTVAAEDQWNVMLHFTPQNSQWTGWGVEHGQGAVDFWAEGPREGDTEVLTMSDSNLPVDAWSHVLAVKRGSDLLLYVDGDQVAAATFDYDAIDYGGADRIDMFLGKHGGSGAEDRHFFGTLDSVAVWDEALSTEDVRTLRSVGQDCR